MATEPFRAIEVVDLSHVRGGEDKQTRRVKLAIQQATLSLGGLAKTIGAEDPTTKLLSSLMPMLQRRGSGSGPASAPAPSPTPSSR